MDLVYAVTDGVFMAEQFFRCLLKVAVRKHTIQQIVNATRYVCDGNDAELYEYPVSKDTGGEGDVPDGDMSAAVGIILGGTASGIGISLADARKMTQSQYRLTVRRYMRAHGLLDEKGERSTASGDYFATLESIRNRLERERDEKANKAEVE